MPAITINDHNMAEFSHFAVKLFFISLKPSASSVLVDDPDHRLSCGSQRTCDVLPSASVLKVGSPL